MEKVEAELTWVEEDDGSQTAKLRLIHLHIFHFGYQLCQDSARDQMKTSDDKNKTRLHKEEGVADGCNHVNYIFKDNKDSNICLTFKCHLPIKDGAHSSTVGAASVDVEACRQQDAIFYRDWAMREWSDKELVPAWVQKREKNCDLSILSFIP